VARSTSTGATPARAAGRFERAFALACDLQDPCWEGLAARNLALHHRVQGQTGSTRSWMDEARARCTRLPDRYVWMHVLDAAIQVDLDEGADECTPQLIRALGALVARTEMRELVVRVWGRNPGRAYAAALYS
jgi:hypothetical protein